MRLPLRFREAGYPVSLCQPRKHRSMLRRSRERTPKSPLKNLAQLSPVRLLAHRSPPVYRQRKFCSIVAGVSRIKQLAAKMVRQSKSWSGRLLMATSVD